MIINITFPDGRVEELDIVAVTVDVSQLVHLTVTQRNEVRIVEANARVAS